MSCPLSCPAETFRPSRAPGLPASLGTAAAALRRRVALWRRARRTALRLEALNDAALRDLGLTRDQIAGIASYTAAQASADAARR